MELIHLLQGRLLLQRDTLGILERVPLKLLHALYALQGLIEEVGGDGLAHVAIRDANLGDSPLTALLCFQIVGQPV